MQGSVASGRPFSSEYHIVRPAGDIRRVRVRAQPTVGSAGTAVGLRGVGQDVTEDATDGRVPAGHSDRPTRCLTWASRSPDPDPDPEPAPEPGSPARWPSMSDASSRRLEPIWARAADDHVGELLGLAERLERPAELVEVLAAGLGSDEVSDRQGYQGFHSELLRFGLGLQAHPHVGVDAQHQHGRRRYGEVPDVEGLLAGDEQTPSATASTLTVPCTGRVTPWKVSSPSRL